MKKLIILSSIAVYFIIIAMTSNTDNNTDTIVGIQFQKGSWNEVLKLAEKEDKLIFLDVYASWCRPCELLKSSTFTDEKADTFFNEIFINYAIDAKKGERISLVEKYNVFGYPTLLFVDSERNLVAKKMVFIILKNCLI